MQIRCLKTWWSMAWPGHPVEHACTSRLVQQVHMVLMTATMRHRHTQLRGVVGRWWLLLSCQVVADVARWVRGLQHTSSSCRPPSQRLAKAVRPCQVSMMSAQLADHHIAARCMPAAHRWRVHPCMLRLVQPGGDRCVAGCASDTMFLLRY
jgi:hypothetical protein